MASCHCIWAVFSCPQQSSFQVFYVGLGLSISAISSASCILSPCMFMTGMSPDEQILCHCECHCLNLSSLHLRALHFLSISPFTSSHCLSNGVSGNNTDLVWFQIQSDTPAFLLHLLIFIIEHPFNMLGLKLSLDMVFFCPICFFPLLDI